LRSACLGWLCQTLCSHAGYLDVSTLHTFKINIFLRLHHCPFRPLQKTSSCKRAFQYLAGYPRILGIIDLASSRSARLQGLLEVGTARLLAAMLGDLGVSTLRSIKTMTQFSTFEHQTSHATCFNARGLLYESVFDALLFSSSYRPVGKLVSHHVTTRSTFFLFWIIIPAILPSTMLGYYSMSASSMPSGFFHHCFDLLEVSFL
jgi:hypothetical protein